MPTTSVRYVTTEAELRDLWSRIDYPSLLAIDTEFDRSHTFYAKLGLIQLSADTDPGVCYLIDTVAIDLETLLDTFPLPKLLSDPNVVKIVHAAGEDVDVLLHYLQLDLALDPQKKPQLTAEQQPIRALFDTQIAAAFLNLGNQMSYLSLIQHYFNHQLSKEQTRSDWLSRPLSDEQLTYAANDVAYLPTCYHLMVAELDALHRVDWVFEESNRHLLSSKESLAIDQYYLKFQQAWVFDRQQVALLQSLCVWREMKAREMDRPRGKIINDSSLFLIAESQPNDKQSLFTLKSLKVQDIRSLKRYADQILERVQVCEQNNSVVEMTPITPPTPKALKVMFKQCKTAMAAVAKQLEIPPERLLPKKELRRLIIAYTHHLISQTALQLPIALQGWRQPEVMPALLPILKAFHPELIQNYQRQAEKMHQGGPASD